MHVKILTPRALPLVVVLAILDTNAIPVALKKTSEVSNDNEETRQTLRPDDGTHKLVRDKDTAHNVYRCHGGTTHQLHHRRKRWIAGVKFDKLLITWTVGKYSTKLTRTEQLSVFNAAFKQWDDVTTAVNFTYVNSTAKADMVISFLPKEHFDDEKTLGHGYTPKRSAHPGDIHLNEVHNWVTTGTDNGVNLLAVTLHEIGHALGIHHTNVVPSVMSTHVSNTRTRLYEPDKKLMREKYGACEIKDLTAVLHDRFGNLGDTLLVLNKGKVYRIWANTGELFHENGVRWPYEIRDYFRITDKIYDKMFPLRAALFVDGYSNMLLFGQKDFSRRIPVNKSKKGGRFYDFDDRVRWFWPEGPLPYSKGTFYTTPPFFKDFLKSNTKFGAAFEKGIQKYPNVPPHYQHYFLNGTHYTVSSHNLNAFTVEDMNVHFPGAPRNPDATWYNNRKREWFFFKGSKYYKWDASVKRFTDRGPITLLWHTVCE